MEEEVKKEDEMGNLSFSSQIFFVVGLWFLNLKLICRQGKDGALNSHLWLSGKEVFALI